MDQVGTFNKNVFYTIWSNMHDTVIAALLHVSKNMFSLYDLYEVDIILLPFSVFFFCSFVSFHLCGFNF